MKPHILFILTLLLSALYAQAEPVTAEKAREKAAAFFSVQQTAGARLRAPAARQLHLAAQDRDNTYYIFNAPNDDGGYVVVSGDDATEEILGYSNSGTINPDDMPCGMKWLLDSYTEQIRYLRANEIREGSRAKASRKTRDAFHLDPNNLARFGQDEPYNDECPGYWFADFPTLYDHCPTGCVATAMAQLMYAYKWPNATTNKIGATDKPCGEHTAANPKTCC